MTLLERVMRLLPDRCQMPNCNRNGVRGNEKIVDSLRMCNECATKHMQREIGLKTAQMERRLECGFDDFFDALKKHDEVRLKSREACLDALEAQCKSTETNTVAILAAIQAEHDAIAACRKSLARL